MPLQKNFDFEAGEVLLLNKPYGWSSFDLVKKVRNLIKFKKIGHAGTLDPLANGLMILCTGKATKSINTIQDAIKVYTGTMKLGVKTPSYDLETMPLEKLPFEHIQESEVLAGIQTFLGKIQQTPPAYSAVKVDGVRMYENARKGVEVEIKSREVEIFDYKLTRFELPEIDFEVTCSKGTYIRTLANDLGNLLGCGATLTRLCRTAIGEYQLKDAWEWKALAEHLQGAKEENSNAAD